MRMGNFQNEVTGSGQCTRTYKRKQTVDGQEVIGSRSYGGCGLKGHYMTTCRMNLNRSSTVEKRGISRGGVRKRGRPRNRRSNPRCCVILWMSRTSLMMWMKNMMTTIDGQLVV
jgi:hypothetical protein